MKKDVRYCVFSPDLGMRLASISLCLKNGEVCCKATWTRLETDVMSFDARRARQTVQFLTDFCFSNFVKPLEVLKVG